MMRWRSGREAAQAARSRRSDPTEPADDIPFGTTGAGKASGPAKHLALGFMATGFGGLVLCAKEERPEGEAWAEDAGRRGRAYRRGS